MKLFARACLAASIALIPVACGGDDENKSKATCGNNEIEGDEVCDGTDLGGENCEGATMMAMPSGTLGCAEDCSAFDTSSCSAGGAGGAGGSTGGSGGSTGGSGGSTGGAGGSTGGMGGMMGPGGTMGMPDGGDAGGMGGGGMGGADAGGAGGSDMDGSVDMDSSTSTPDAAADSGDGG